MTLEIVPFERGFGAEVRGIAPDLDIPDAQFRQVSDAWTRHSVLRFRGLRMSPEQHIAFSRRLGPLHIMKPLKFNLEGHPEVFVVSNASKDDPSRPVTRNEAGEAGLRRAGTKADCALVLADADAVRTARGSDAQPQQRSCERLV